MSGSTDFVSAASFRKRKRQDIQLLRALAVVAVVGYHFALPGFELGFLGVDIFLVISGYLVGGGLLSEFATAGRINLRRFFTHRIKRLLPASIVVVIATVILLYSTQLLTTRDLRHALFSSLYVQNINLAIEGGDYLGKDLLPTYFVHFWSLSLEEQFYVFVPVIMLLIAVVKLKKRALAVFLVIGIVSLALSIYQTSLGDSSAYFSLTTRAWQFILGMLVANLNPSKTFARWLWMISLLGLAGFIVLINLDSGILFPAPGAIIPSVITALALAAGKTVALRIPIAPLQATGVFIGDLSYSIYLVHFSISLIVAGLIEQPEYPLFVAGGLVLTLALAFVLKTAIEDPVRFPGFYGQRFKFGPVKILLANLALTTSILVAIQGLTAPSFTPPPASANEAQPTAEATSASPTATSSALPTSTSTASSSASPSASPAVVSKTKPTAESCFGARAMIDESCGSFILSKPLLPPQSANEWKSEAYTNGCHIPYSQHPNFKSCTYGATKNYKATIALVGDSHATQWLPAFDVAGKAAGVRVKTFLISECVFGSVLIPAYCKDYTPWVMRSLEAHAKTYSAVFVSNRVSRPEIEKRSSFIKRTFTKTLQSLQLINPKIFFIDDTPIGTLDHTDPNICLLAKAPKNCYGLKRDVVWGNPFAAAVQKSGIGEYIAVDNLFCIGNKCYRSIGGLPVYRDDDHINVKFSESTIDLWKARFEELLKPVPSPTVTTSPTSTPTPTP